jgi:3-oxoacyl-[acyl-carrier protein] reductase
MDLGLRGKAAIVTGASQGIGRAIALRLAEEGAAVATCARGEPALREVEPSCALGRPRLRRGVRRGNAEVLDGFLDTARQLGRVDIMVNNPSGFAFADERAWESTLNGPHEPRCGPAGRSRRMGDAAAG